MVSLSVRRLCVLAAVLLALGLSHPASGQGAQGFDAWLEGVWAEARAAGIRDATLHAALDGLNPIARVIELDRRQPERVHTFDEYLAARVTPALVEKGRHLYDQHGALLGEVRTRYGVPPRFIVALWGLETHYGRHMGSFAVIGALATLAYDTRRSAFFRRQLLAALEILDEGHITPEAMVGSWAGAMGQSQFLPSSFLKFAVDFDGDGRRDIWTSEGDVFASAANYLAGSGWRVGERWGREVTLPQAFNRSLVGLDVTKPLREWRALGLRPATGGELPDGPLEGSVLLPGGDEGPAYLVFDNYRVILKWNRSDYFAMAVGRLADLIGER
ncbi:MAG: lytic transglycosylase domain-containing protein [Alphaproteobacteria bacterium]